MFSAIKSARLTGNPYTSDQPMKIHEGFGVSLGAALKGPHLRGIVPSYLADASEFAPPPTGSTIMTSGALVMDGNFEGRTAGNQLRSNRTLGAHASDVSKYTDAQINLVTQTQKTREGMSRPVMAVPMRFSHEGFKEAWGGEEEWGGQQQPAMPQQLELAREMTHPTYAAQLEAVGRQVAAGLVSAAEPRMRGVMNMVQQASRRDGEGFALSRLGASKTGSTTTTLKDMAASSEPFRRRRW
jgi:hypothetical protein